MELVFHDLSLSSNFSIDNVLDYADEKTHNDSQIGKLLPI